MRNVHTFGTHTRIVQLDDFHFELLAIAAGADSAARTAGEGMPLNALRVSVADLDTTSTVLRAGNAAAVRHGDRIVIPPAASGATLVFEAAQSY